MTPAGTSNELDVQNEWEENTHNTLPFHFCMESTLYVFLPDGVFLPCDHQLDFDVSLFMYGEEKRKHINWSMVICQGSTRLELS